MRVLLIAPPVNSFTGLLKRGYPLGLCMLAAVAKEEKVDSVAVYDVDKCHAVTYGLDFTHQRENMDAYLHGINNSQHPVWKEIEAKLVEHRPDLVGITTMTIDYASALRVAEIVKRWNPYCLVVMGGAQASVMPRAMIEWPFTDAIVRGEGEEAFRGIIRKIGSGSTALEQIPGVVTKSSMEKCDAPPVEIKNIDELPFADRESLLNPENYSPEDMGLMLTSRGCPFRCSYCSNFTIKTRFRSVEQVIDEIQGVQKAYGTFQFMFKDDSFTVNRRRVSKFCQVIKKKNIRIAWESTTRLDLVDDALVTEMKSAGCNRVGVGVESGDDGILQVLNKRLTKDQIRRSTTILDKNRLFWTGYFMMGLPMETEPQMLATLEFMKELKPPYAALGIYKPYPGTKLFEFAEQSGLVTKDVGNEHFLHTNPVDYFLIDPRRRSRVVSAEKLEAMAAMMEREFDRSNKRITNVLKRASSRRLLYARHPRSFVTDVMRFVKWR